LNRAEIAEAAGETNRALRDYARFLKQFDLADPALRLRAGSGGCVGG
jgi:hypothetical protein